MAMNKSKIFPNTYLIVVLLFFSCFIKHQTLPCQAKIRIADGDDKIFFNLDNIQIQYYADCSYKLEPNRVLKDNLTFQYASIKLIPGDNIVFVITGEHVDESMFDGDYLSILILMEIETYELNDTIDIELDVTKNIAYFHSDILPFVKGLGTQLQGDLVILEQSSNKLFGKATLNGILQYYRTPVDDISDYCNFSFDIDFVAEKQKVQDKEKVIKNILIRFP